MVAEAMAEALLTPSMKWAQDKDFIYASVSLNDVANVKVDMTETMLSFTCSQDDGQKKYAISFELADKVVVDKSKYEAHPRGVYIILAKKEQGPFWSSLPKDSKKWKSHVLIDWDKWVDSDNEDADDPSRFGDMAGLLGGGGQVPGDLGSLMQNMGDMDGMDDKMPADFPEEDSDDDDMPALEEAEPVEGPTDN